MIRGMFKKGWKWAIMGVCIYIAHLVIEVIVANYAWATIIKPGLALAEKVAVKYI